MGNKEAAGSPLAGALVILLAGACGMSFDIGPGDPNALPSTEPGATTTPNTATAPSGLPCDINNLLTTRCQTCHSANPQYGAPMPLVTWDDLQRPASMDPTKKVYQRVQERVHSVDQPMPPGSQPRLSDQEIASLDAWIAAGAPSSDATCASASVGAAVKPLSCTPDTFLKANKPFTLQPGATDQYVCYGVDIDLKKKRHVIGFAPRVDNKDIVHHILLFQTTTAVSADPFFCPAFGSGVWKLMAGWAPGANNLELPPEAGFPEGVGRTHWVLQIHYNTSKTKTGTDTSGYDLCTTEDLRPNDAGVLGFGSMSFRIPPRSNYTVRCDYRLGPEFKNVAFFNAWPHMHRFGSAMSTERLVGGNGVPEPVLSQTNFSFESQLNFPLTTRVAPGDILRTRCSWKNPSDATIGFGEGTGDEMCYDFISYYPNIPDKSVVLLPLFTWTTPAMYASCVDEK